MGYLRNRLTVPIKGYNRSIIYDLIRKDYFFIPNSIFDIIKTEESFEIEDNEIKSFLLNEEIIFKVNDSEVNFFPSLELDYNDPYDFNNIYIDSDVSFTDANVFENSLIYNVSILIKIINGKVKLSINLINFLEIVEPESIELHFIGDSSKLSDFDLTFFQKFSQTFSIYVYNSIINNILKSKIKKYDIEFIEVSHNFSEYYKNVYPSKFSVNIEHFIEAKHYNTYFNKNIYINKKGNISNGLTGIVEINFNEINSYFDILKNKNLLKVWNVTKDQTLICKDCEFRFMCVDSRLLYKTGNFWSQKDECTYNPYISKWKGEENYYNLKEIGIYMDELGNSVLDEERIKLLNKKIWFEK